MTVYVDWTDTRGRREHAGPLFITILFIAVINKKLVKLKC